MGIVNATPDSFSDGGKFLNANSAIEHAHRLIEDGADIIDIGGESTRPGFTPVSAAEELDRVMPVLAGLKDADVPVSVDTRNYEVMKTVLDAGASIINCVDTLDEQSPAFELIKKTGAGFVYTTRFDTVSEDCSAYRRIELRYGIENQMVLDLGIGFNKTRDDDLALLGALPRLAKEFPVLTGVSRKRIIGQLTGEKDPLERLGGNIGAAVWCALNNAAVLRVHDVRETRQAVDTVLALNNAMCNDGRMDII